MNENELENASNRGGNLVFSVGRGGNNSGGCFIGTNWEA